MIGEPLSDLDSALAAALQDNEDKHVLELAGRIARHPTLADQPSLFADYVRRWLLCTKVSKPLTPSHSGIWFRPFASEMHALFDRAQNAAARLRLDDPGQTPLRYVRLVMARGMGSLQLVERILIDTWRSGPPDERRCGACRLHGFLVYQGRGSELPVDELMPSYTAVGKPQDCIRHQFYDAVEAGRFEEAHELWASMPTREQGIDLTIFYAGELAILDATRRGRMVDDRALAGVLSRLDSQAPHLSRDLRNRLALCTADTTRLTAIIAENSEHTSSQWNATAGIEAKAMLGDWDGVRHLLRSREGAGLHIVSDDIYTAAAHFAAGEHDDAAIALASAEATARRQGSLGRADMHLRLMRRPGPFDLLALGRRLPRRTTGTPPTTMIADEDPLAGTSEAMNRVRSQILRYAVLDLPVLVTGPSGVGKDLAARRLHHASGRSQRPYVACNCAAITAGLLETELFGHVRGAFTGADRARAGLIDAARDGTLFLDEIGDASPEFQAALLRLLDHGEYRAVGSAQTRRALCRFICATNVDLDSAVAAGHFRGDLLYRLRRLEIVIPPLAERPEDLVPIAYRLLASISPQRVLADEVGPWLRGRAWPGNVRELRGLLERIGAEFPDGPITATMLAACSNDRSSSTFRVDSHSRALRHETGSQPRLATDDVPAASDQVTRKVAGGNSNSPSTAISSMDRRLARVAEQIQANGSITRKELCHHLGISPVTATTYLKLLCARGQVRRVEPSASVATHFFQWVG